jgi:hypothetical protein
MSRKILSPLPEACLSHSLQPTTTLAPKDSVKPTHYAISNQATIIFIWSTLDKFKFEDHNDHNIAH